MANAPGAPSVNRRFENIDMVRGIAAVMVVIQHSGERVGSKYLSGYFQSHWINFGQAGVIAFFLVSGFVIPLSLEKKNSISLFVMNRAFRIYPLYLFVFLISCFVFWRLPTPTEIVAQMLFITDYVGVRNFVYNSWTLSVELGWYILFVALFMVKSNRRNLLIGATAAGVVVGGAVFDKALHHIPLGRLCMIATCIVGLLTFRIVEARSKGARSAILILTASIVLSLVIGFGFSKYEAKLEYTLNGMLASWSLGYVLFFASFHLKLPIFIERGLKVLGKISYSVYLMHTFAMIAISNFAISGISYIACVVVASIMLAIPTYLFIEQPAVRYAHNRWRRAKDGVIDSKIGS